MWWETKAALAGDLPLCSSETEEQAAWGILRLWHTAESPEDLEELVDLQPSLPPDPILNPWIWIGGHGIHIVNSPLQDSDAEDTKLTH